MGLKDNQMFSALLLTSGVFLDWIFFRSESRFSASNRDEINTPSPRSPLRKVPIRGVCEYYSFASNIAN